MLLQYLSQITTETDINNLHKLIIWVQPTGVLCNSIIFLTQITKPLNRNKQDDSLIQAY